MQLLSKITGGTFNIGNYGEVIISGYGLKPTKEVKSYLKDKYNFDFDSKYQ